MANRRAIPSRTRAASRATPLRPRNGSRVAIEALEFLRLWAAGLNDIAALQHDNELLRTATAPLVQQQRAHAALLADVERITARDRTIRKQLRALASAARQARPTVKR